MTTIAPAPLSLTDAEIVAHYQARTLLPELRRHLNPTQQDALCVQLAALHNAGAIDLRALTATPAFQVLDGQQFFAVQLIYSRVMPLLAAPSLGRLVTKLVTTG